MKDTIVFDVDGTLVDTNYHHALAWFRAFGRFDVVTPIWRIHRAIGMGGDRLVAAVAGDDVERRHGDDLRQAWTEEYAPLISEVRPFSGARDVVVEARRRGLTVVLASSAPGEHVNHYLDLLDARDIVQHWTTAEDAEQSKPAPDLVQIAMQQVQADDSVMIGDSTWDVEAAERAGIACVAVRTGGFSVSELEAAGAKAVYESLDELRGDLDAVLD